MEKVISGLHGIEEALRSGKNAGRLYLSRKSSRIDRIKTAAEKAGMEIVNIPPAEMTKRFGEDTRGVVLQLFGNNASGDNPAKRKSGKGDSPVETQGIGSFEDKVDSIKSENAIIVILDGVTDPHNYGAILRCADQFGVDLVVTRARRSVTESDTVARTSSGAVNFVNTAVVGNLSRAIDYLKNKGFWVYSADMGGAPLYSTVLTGKTAVVMGSEGKGVSRLVSEKCDAEISIPSEGRIDSLNVSVAAGIILYEIKRQQSVLL